MPGHAVQGGVQIQALAHGNHSPPEKIHITTRIVTAKTDFAQVEPNFTLQNGPFFLEPLPVCDEDAPSRFVTILSPASFMTLGLEST